MSDFTALFAFCIKIYNRNPYIFLFKFIQGYRVLKIKHFLSAIFLLWTVVVFAQDDAYYSSINPNNSAFINDLKLRLRSPYTKISYDNFDETNVANFASYLIGGSTRGVRCVYSWYEYTYTGTFTWEPMSREHTWCYSWMPSSNTANNEYADQHHLFPVHQNGANGVRSNHPLGIVTTVTSSFLDSKYGKNSSNQNVFEPRNQHKGDAARAILYMSVRYDGTSGTWNFNWLNGTKLPSLGEAPQSLQVLLDWHRQDPPDKWEVDRNNYVQGIQQNRNPFVDHPEYVNYINFNDLTKLSPVYSNEPSNHVTGLSASVSGASITLNWTGATGTNLPTGYLIQVYNRNSFYIPIDGYELSENTSLDSFKVKYVSHVSGINSYTFTGLTENTRYYFRVYPYADDGTVAKRNYKIDGTIPSVNEVAGSSSLVANPLSFTAAGSSFTQIDLSATANSNGNNIVVVYNGSGTFTAPVDGIAPGNIGSSLAGGTILYKGAASSLTNHSGLSSGVTVYYKIFSYNGSNVYSTGITRNATTLITAPSLQASNLTFSSVTSEGMTINWTNGNGQNRVVYMNTINSFLPPSDGSNPIANNSYTFGQQCVYNSNGTSVSVTGLSEETTYWFRVYEYNNTGSNTLFNTNTSSNNPNSQASSSLITFKEDFETGTKGGYTPGSVTCTKGSWSMSEALIGNLSGDKKNGLKSVRMRNADGFIQMEFDKSNGARDVTVYYAIYGTDNSSQWKLQKSTNAGVNWTDVGTTITATSQNLTAQVFNVNQIGNVRFKIVHVTGGSTARLNIDDVTITDYDKVITGSTQLNASEYGNLTVNGSGINVTLSGNTTVNGTLTLDNGYLQIGSNNLILGTNAVIGGSPSEHNMIVADGTGKVIKNISGTGSFTFPVGDNNYEPEYSPVTLNFTSGTFGTGAYVSLNLKNEVHPWNSTSPLRIKRYWTIEQNNISGFSCNASFTMLEADLAGTGSQSELYCWKWNGTAWVKGNLISGNILSFDNINSFSDFTGSGNDQPLPVSLSSFISSVIIRNVKLNWVTESEINNSGFHLQRSVVSGKGAEWQSIGFVEGKGTKSTPTSYEFEDRNVQTGRYQYRLKQVDYNGNYEYFMLENEVEITAPKKFNLSQNYPNPFNPETKISYDIPSNTLVKLVIYDVMGREVQTLVKEIQKPGVYEVKWNASRFASGVYFARIEAGSFTKSIKLLLMK